MPSRRPRCLHISRGGTETVRSQPRSCPRPGSPLRLGVHRKALGAGCQCARCSVISSPAPAPRVSQLALPRALLQGPGLCFLSATPGDRPSLPSGTRVGVAAVSLLARGSGEGAVHAGFQRVPSVQPLPVACGKVRTARGARTVWGSGQEPRLSCPQRAEGAAGRVWRGPPAPQASSRLCRWTPVLGSFKRHRTICSVSRSRGHVGLF